MRSVIGGPLNGGRPSGPADQVHVTLITPLELSGGGAGVDSGETIMAVGYPFQELLLPEPRIFTGVVSALSGFGGDKRFVQMTAPVQPGSSGGPLLDMSGHISWRCRFKGGCDRCCRSDRNLARQRQFCGQGPSCQDCAGEKRGPIRITSFDTITYRSGGRKVGKGFQSVLVRCSSASGQESNRGQ